MPPGVGSGEAGARWGVSGGGGEGAGGCGHALAALRKCNQVWVVAKPGWGGVWAVGVVRARGGVGTHWQPLNTLNTKEMRASGEAGVGWGVGARGGEGAGGCGHALAAFKYFLNTYKMRARCG